MPKTIISKPCTKCKITKPLADFHKDRYKPDSHTCSCKSCQREENSISYHYLGGKATRIASGKAYRQTVQGKINQRKYSQKRRHCHPQQMMAYSALHYAIRSGTIPHPSTLTCGVCNEPAEEYHHHLGYDKKHHFDVIPLCADCHRSMHKR